MNTVKFLSIASALLFTQLSFAMNNPSPHWELLLLGGAATLSQDEITLMFREGLPPDSLKQDNQDSWGSWTVVAGVGYAIPLYDLKPHAEQLQWLPFIQPQLKVYFLDGPMDGTLDQFYTLPGEGVDTEYSINLQSTRLMFDLALTILSWKNFSIYGVSGIGPSWNRVDFHSKENNCLLARDINAQTDTNFAVELGAGLNYELIPSLSLTAEYLYTKIYAIGLADTGESNGSIVAPIHSDSFDVQSQAIIAGLRFAF